MNTNAPTLADLFAAAGFSEEGTGGGCLALALPVKSLVVPNLTLVVLVTDMGGTGLPVVGEAALVGVHDMDGQELRCDVVEWTDAAALVRAASVVAVAYAKNYERPVDLGDALASFLDTAFENAASVDPGFETVLPVVPAWEVLKPTDRSRVVRFADGSEFQVTIVQSKRGQ